MTDILITSHSSFIISDCYLDKVIAFEKDKQPINAREMKPMPLLDFWQSWF